MNTIGLIFFIVLHWVFILTTTLYIFVRKSNKYDMLYFTLICTIFTSWLFTGKECIISYWETLCVDSTYVYGTDATKHHFVNSVFHEKLRPIIWGLISILTVSNLYVMMDIYDVPIPIRISILCFYIYPGLKPKIKKYMKDNKIKNNTL